MNNEELEAKKAAKLQLWEKMFVFILLLINILLIIINYINLIFNTFENHS